MNRRDELGPRHLTGVPHRRGDEPVAPTHFDYGEYGRYRDALESGGRDDAANPNSSALGRHQFIEDTWLGLIGRHKPEWAEGLTQKELLALRTDPAKSSEMVAHFDQENAQALRLAGVPVNNQTLYAAHHFGPGKGVQFAKAGGDTPMADILTPGQMRANSYLEGLTKDQAIAVWNRRAGKAGADAAVGARSAEPVAARVQGEESARATDREDGLQDGLAGDAQAPKSDDALLAKASEDAAGEAEVPQPPTLTERVAQAERQDRAAQRQAQDGGEPADAVSPETTPAPEAPNPVQAALARIAKGEGVRDVLADMPNDVARATANALGRDFADTAKASNIAEFMGKLPGKELAERARRAAVAQDPVKALRELAEMARANGNENRTVRFVPVNEATARAIREAGMRDVSGYTHTADLFAVRHILKEHGDAKSEVARGNIPVTHADIAALPDVVSKPDKLVLGQRNKIGRDMVISLKHMPDGTTLYVEEIRTGARSLAAQSMRKYPATTPDSSIIEALRHIRSKPASRGEPIVVDLSAVGMRKYPGTKDSDTIAKSVLPSYARSDTGDVRIVYPDGARGQAERTAIQSAGHLGQGSVPLAEGGKPFKMRAQAAQAKAMQPAMRVVSVDGGWALSGKTPEQLAAQAKAAGRLALARTGKAGQPIAAHEFIAGEGGLSRAVASDLGVEDNPRIGNRWLYASKGKGLTIEQATQKLREAGYIRGDSHNEALDVIRRSLKQPQYTPEGWNRIAEAETKTRFEDHLAAHDDGVDAAARMREYGATEDDLADAMFTGAPPELQAEVLALRETAESLGIDVEAIIEYAAKTGENLNHHDYLRHERYLLQQAIARNASSHRAQAASAGGRQAGGQEAKPRGDGDAGADHGDAGAPQNERGATGDAKLTSYSESELRQREQQRQDAETERKRQAKDDEQRARADAERGDFALTGSDRPADEAEARGQRPMFSRGKGESPDDALADSARRYFGITQDPREAGYILPSGDMLDFSGRHYSEDHPSLRGQRNVDHRELTGENKHGESLDDLFHLKSGNASDYMMEFMGRTAAMRVDFNAGVASVIGRPTPEQIKALGRGLRGDYLALSLVDGANGRIVADAEIDHPTPQKIARFFARHEGESAPANAPLFSRRESGRGMPTDAVQAHVDAIKGQWENAPEIEVVRNMADPRIPESVRAEEERQRSQGASGNVEGFFHEGKVYVLADHMASPADVARVVLHESIGHYGLHGVFGEKLGAVLDQLAWQRRGELVAKAREYGFVPDHVANDAMPGKVYDAMDKTSRRLAAEEMLADLAAKQPQLGFVKRAVAEIRTWLRENIPGFKNLALSDAEIIRDIIIPARRFVRDGPQAAERDGVAFSRSAIKSVQANIERGRDAMNTALLEKHDVNRAMYRNDLGWVDFVWGDSRKGLQHIVEQRMAKDGLTESQATRMLTGPIVETIARGQTRRKTVVGNVVRLAVDYNGHEAQLVQRKGGNGWLLTGYEIHQKNEKPSGGQRVGFDTSKPTQTVPTLARHGLGADGSISMPQTGRPDNTPRFSRAGQDNAAKRADELLRTPARGQVRVLDRMLRFATNDMGLGPRDAAGTKKYSVEGLTKAIGKAGVKILSMAPERIKAGLVSDYGVPEAAIDARTLMWGRKLKLLREAGGPVGKLAALTNHESQLAYDWMTGRDPDAAMKALAELPQESIATLKQLREMVDGLSREAVELGILDARSYERNKGAYLHRSYLKHALKDQPGDGGSKGGGKGAALLGQNMHARGIFQTARMDRVKPLAPHWWDIARKEGKADPDLIGRRLIRMERRAPSGEGTQTMPGMDGKPKGRVLEVAWVPEGREMPRAYAEWDRAGTWEVRDVKGNELQLWRDYTPAERERMGEIRDVRYAVTSTLQGMIADVETARYFDWLGKKFAMPEGAELPEGHTLAERAGDSGWGLAHSFKTNEWVQVPDTKVAGTSVKKYGRLAGKYLPGPIWNDVRQVARGGVTFDGTAGRYWQSVTNLWKTSKTAWSPAVHMNNVMSNFMMADWADLTPGHMAKALRIIMGAHGLQGEGVLGGVGNLAAKLTGMADREAASEIMARYRESGAEIGSWSFNEMAGKQIDPLLKQIEADVLAGKGTASVENHIGLMAAISHLQAASLEAKAGMGGAAAVQLAEAVRAAAGSKPAKLVTREFKTMQELYGSEDGVFRLAAWLKAKEEGKTDLQAGKIARAVMLDYNINAPWIKLLKSTAVPFISWTYRALPLGLSTLANKPHKFMKYAMFFGGLNALFTSMAGDSPDDDKRRRALLADEKRGYVWGGDGWGIAPKLMRMPWNDAHGSPVYLDIRRFVPLGDVYDVGQTHSAIPMLPALQLSGPLGILAELSLNKSSFTGKEITLETDTGTEKASKVAKHMWSAFTPNLLGLPGSYATSNVVDSLQGKTDAFGRELSPEQAISNSFGVKLGSYPEDVLRQRAAAQARAPMNEIQKQISAINRQYQINAITEEDARAKIAAQTAKQQEIAEELRRRMNP